MSSFIGHALTATFIFTSDKTGQKDCRKSRFAWLLTLIAVAMFPDLDYFVPYLSKENFNGLRISHSLIFSLLTPLIIILVLFFCFHLRGRELRWKALQLVMAGLSHIILDFCVGVHPLPIFFPLSTGAFRAPVGLLPSAGSLNPTNFYLYRNLVVELGVLMPFFICIRRFLLKKHTTRISHGVTATLLTISVTCIYIASTFTR